MKKILISGFTICLLFAGILSSYAQQAEGINYQAVIRNASGAALASQVVNMRFSILSGSSSGTVVYSETLAGTTNGQGVLSAVIGTGTATTGVWKDLSWLVGPYFIKVEADPAGGTTFADLGTSQLVSVPLAKQAGGVVLFEGGTQNPDKMIVAHSSTYSNWGIRYSDTMDVVQFVASGSVMASIALGTGNASFGNVTVNEVNRTSTGAANLVPIAYGTISPSGAVLGGTGNFTVAKVGTGSYAITIAGENYYYSDYTTSATAVGSGAIILSVSSAGGSLTVYTHDTAGTNTDTNFYFVTYKN